MARDKNFYDYGMAVEYVTAKNNGDKEKMIELQQKTYTQYMELAHKMKWDFVKRLQKTYLTTDQIYDITEGYESDIYGELVKAMDSIKLEKIPNKVDKNGKRTWTFYAAYWGYLMTYNRDETKRWIEKSQNEMSVDYDQSSGENGSQGDATQFLAKNKAAMKMEEIETQSPEKLYEEQTQKKVFWQAVDNCLTKRFNATQVKIWNVRASFTDSKKESVAAICEKLKISPKEYHREMRGIKEIFDNEVKTLSDIY